MDEKDLRVFGGPYVAYDGRDYACYTVEWRGTEPPTRIRLGDVTYVAEGREDKNG